MDSFFGHNKLSNLVIYKILFSSRKDFIKAFKIKKI